MTQKTEEPSSSLPVSLFDLVHTVLALILHQKKATALINIHQIVPELNWEEDLHFPTFQPGTILIVSPHIGFSLSSCQFVPMCVVWLAIMVHFSFMNW